MAGFTTPERDWEPITATDLDRLSSSAMTVPLASESQHPRSMKAYSVGSTAAAMRTRQLGCRQNTRSSIAMGASLTSGPLLLRRQTKQKHGTQHKNVFGISFGYVDWPISQRLPRHFILLR